MPPLGLELYQKGRLAMTRAGKKELSKKEHEQIARLMYLHSETHPARIARLYGIGVRHVRQLWADHMQWESATPEEALLALRDRAKRA